MFGNENPETNGEQYFYNQYIKNTDVIFDVGCSNDSIFLSHSGSVHYFDPVPKYVYKLSTKQNNNNVAFFNAFGLSDFTGEVEYYKAWESITPRLKTASNGIYSDNTTSETINVKTGSEYMDEHNIEKVDFLKIDTEGHELNVLKGFGPRLVDVKIVQWEYGGTFIDTGVSIKTVFEILQKNGFTHFYYLNGNQNPVEIDIAKEKDHYKYSNIISTRYSLF